MWRVNWLSALFHHAAVRIFNPAWSPPCLAGAGHMHGLGAILPCHLLRKWGLGLMANGFEHGSSGLGVKRRGRGRREAVFVEFEPHTPAGADSARTQVTCSQYPAGQRLGARTAGIMGRA